MFGTMGFSELVIILVIVLIIFGAGRLPQIGEGVGKALKGFKKEVNEMPPPIDPTLQEQPAGSQGAGNPPSSGDPQASAVSPPPGSGGASSPAQPGPERTPGTTAALMYEGAGPQAVQSGQLQGGTQTTAEGSKNSVPPPVTMEQRATAPPPQLSTQYPPLPPSARPKPAGKRPSAIVNKDAVARVQAQQAAMQAKPAQASAPASQDMQSLGEGLGSALRTFREAASDVRNSIDPEMRTIQAELQAAEKEVEDTIESAKQSTLPKDPPAVT